MYVCIYVCIYILAAGKIEYVPIRKIPIGIFYLLVPGGVYVSFRGAQKYQTYRTHVGESGERVTLMFESWRMYCAVFLKDSYRPIHLRFFLKRPSVRPSFRAELSVKNGFF